MKIRPLFVLLLIAATIVCAVIFVTELKKKSEQKIAFPKNEQSQDVDQPVMPQADPVVSIAPPPIEFSTSDEMVRFGLSELLKRDVSFAETYRRENNDWIIICGQPKELDGRKFRYENSPLRDMAIENLIEDKFCQLAKKTKNGYILLENDIGSLDSPILSWLSDYQLPSDLIK